MTSCRAFLRTFVFIELGEQAHSLDELAILSLLFSFRVKHSLWSLMLSGISRPSGSRSESGSLGGGLAFGVVSLRVRASHFEFEICVARCPH